MVLPGFRWWHAVVIFVVANIASILPAGYNGDEAFYNGFTLPALAPPDWLFAPMWLFLNITSLVALSRIANSSPRPARTAFLISEGVGWVLFAIFTTLYFVLRSPILGAVDTVFSLLVATLSVVLSSRIDRQATIHITFRLLWLLLASYVSVWVVIHNADPFFSGRTP